MQHLLLVDETFDLNFTQEYCLSIQFNLDGFSFCILDSLQNKYIYLFHKELSGNPQFLMKKLSDIYSEFDILESAFKTTRIIYSTPGKTNVVPSHLFSEIYAKDIYRVNKELEPEETLYHLPLKKYGAVMQMALWSKVKDFLQEKHPGTIVQNDLADFLNAYEHQEADKPLLYVQLHKNLVTILTTDGSLRFFNSFFYLNENDLLYYILNVAKSMQSSHPQVLLNGRVNKRSAIFHRLRQYFAEVNIAGRTSEVYYSYLFDQLPDARFVNLLNTIG